MKEIEQENWVMAVKDPVKIVRRVSSCRWDYIGARELQRASVRYYRGFHEPVWAILVREKFMTEWEANHQLLNGIEVYRRRHRENLKGDIR